MVDSWGVTGIAEIPAFTAAELPGLDGMHVGQYRQNAPSGAYIFEVEYPEFPVIFSVVGNGEGFVHAHLAQGILTLGTIARFYKTDTHTVVLLEEMEWLSGSIARSTDPVIRVRLRPDYETDGVLRIHTAGVLLPEDHEVDLPIKIPRARTRMKSEEG